MKKKTSIVSILVLGLLCVLVALLGGSGVMNGVIVAIVEVLLVTCMVAIYYTCSLKNSKNGKLRLAGFIIGLLIALRISLG